MTRTILVVEDEKRIREAVTSYLKIAGYVVIEAQDGKAAIEKFEDNEIDLVILDVMLPMLDGWTVLRRIREHSDVMVIMLTALESEYDKLQGFELGADEYVTKPFSPKVLVARAKALFARSPQHQTSERIELGGLVLDKTGHDVTLNGDKLVLTPKEHTVLEYFMQNQKCALSRDQILHYAWGYDFFGDNRVVDTHVKNLRAKLREYGRYIQTVKGVGYRFEVCDE
ncbi:MAG: response regulator transcription factor [Clostridia bacterium]|jgi:DNA-binding response OmpR family regulator|nr:response regulator transcription factor [Clostridia bacterium]MBT7121711.1 response regulator transcription factor [Clostridia bacterium]